MTYFTFLYKICLTRCRIKWLFKSARPLYDSPSLWFRYCTYIMNTFIKAKLDKSNGRQTNER